MPAGRQERVRLETRPHGVVLAPALAKALMLAAGGAAIVVLGWPASPAGAAALGLAAVLALRAVWRWERTRVLVTSERLVVVAGTLRRTRAEVPLARVRAVEVEQGFLGRLLGYGTVVAGDLEVSYVPDPRGVADLAAR